MRIASLISYLRQDSHNWQKFSVYLLLHKKLKSLLSIIIAALTEYI